MLYVAKTVYYEQLAKIRRVGPLQPVRTHNHRHDMVRVIKAFLIRRDVFMHIKLTFPLMKQFLDIYDTPAYYKARFGINADFTLASGKLAVNHNIDEEEMDVIDQQMEDALVPSTYSCHKDGELALRTISLFQHAESSTLQLALVRPCPLALPRFLSPCVRDWRGTSWRATCASWQ